jgi:hypothetical protein
LPTVFFSEKRRLQTCARQGLVGREAGGEGGREEGRQAGREGGREEAVREGGRQGRNNEKTDKIN